jgi:hypothetical protein
MCARSPLMAAALLRGLSRNDPTFCRVVRYNAKGDGDRERDTA